MNNEIKLKPITEKGFIMFNDEYYKLLAKLLQSGYHEIYFDADYYWSVVNPKTKVKFTLVEGDTFKVTHNNIEDLINDIESDIEWLIDQEHSKNVYGEWETTKEELLKELN